MELYRECIDILQSDTENTDIHCVTSFDIRLIRNKHDLSIDAVSRVRDSTVELCSDIRKVVCVDDIVTIDISARILNVLKVRITWNQTNIVFIEGQVIFIQRT